MRDSRGHCGPPVEGEREEGATDPGPGRAGPGRCPCWALGGDHGKGEEDGKRETGLRLAVAGGRSQKT